MLSNRHATNEVRKLCLMTVKLFQRCFDVQDSMGTALSSALHAKTRERSHSARFVRFQGPYTLSDYCGGLLKSREDSELN